MGLLKNVSQWTIVTAAIYYLESLFLLFSDRIERAPAWMPFTLLACATICVFVHLFFNYLPLLIAFSHIRRVLFPAFVIYISIYSAIAYFQSWQILTHTHQILFLFALQESVIGVWIIYLLERKDNLVPTSVTFDNEQKEVLEVGNAIATMRLLKDLKSISKKPPSQLGFSVEPAIDKHTEMENIYHWYVKFSHFDIKTPLGRDLKSKSNGTISLEVRFSADYPYVPPFVRVIKPRFQFRTGHITIGGSVCMEILTLSGWNSANDIESLLLQIRQGLIDGGARVEMGSNSEYSESEAWSAFYRAAGTHNWKVTGLNPNKFPKTNV